jgi:hypothetical protein
MGASTSHNPMGHHGLLQGQLYLFTRKWTIFVLYNLLSFYDNLFKKAANNVSKAYSDIDN